MILISCRIIIFRFNYMFINDIIIIVVRRMFEKLVLDNCLLMVFYLKLEDVLKIMMVIDIDIYLKVIIKINMYMVCLK